MEAVIARDEKKAARLMDAHLSATQRAVSAILQTIGGDAR
jgi:DNA-binding GntR family transcriptional regulator